MRAAALLVSMALLACGGTAPRGAETSSPPPPAIPDRPDPGPETKRRTGIAVAHQLPEETAKALATFANGDHFYVEIPFESSEGPVAHMQVEGARHGFAVPRPGDAIVRFEGRAAPADGVEIVWSSAQQGSAIDLVGGARQRIRIVGIAAARPAKRLVKEFYLGAASWFRGRGEQGGRTQPFYPFAASRLERLAEGPATGGPTAIARERRTELAEAMSLYTGLESVDEAMQADRGLLLRPARRLAEDEPTIDAAEIPGNALPPHPWEAMLAAPGAPHPVIEPLAASIPANVLYLYFHDLRTFVTLADEIDGWAWPLLETLEARGGAAHFIARYETQLAVERTELSKSLGNLVTDGVAIVAGDPLLREGTDVSIVFQVRNRALLGAILEDFARRAAARRPDVTRGELDLGGGARAKVLATPDHEVYRLELELGDLLILSNSPAALARFAGVRAGQRPSLAQAGDFRWMRAVYPFDPKAEDGFAFAGDALIAALTGPRWKILQARRMEARADLLAVNHAALLYGWLEGRQPRSADELIASGLLRRDELLHEDGAAIAFTPSAGARSRWGSASALVPIADLELGKVSVAERTAYVRFVETYQQYWRGYIDPIATRIRRADGGKRVAFDARMLPLIAGSDYDHLIDQVGEQTIAPPRIASGAELTLAVGADAKLRSELDGAAHELTGRRDFGLAWLGDWVAIGASDRSGLWDAAFAAGAIPEIRGEGDERGRWDFGRLAHLPVYLAAQVKSRVALAAMLTGARAFVEASAAGVVDWHAAAPYRGVETVTIEERPRTGQSRELKGLALHYAIPGDEIVLTLDRATLEQQIDAVLAGRAPGKGTDAQVAVMVSPGAATGWLARTLAALLEKDAIAATRSAARAHEALFFGLGGKTGALAGADAGERRRLALSYLGLEPRSPQGGELTVDATGLVGHSIYGSEVEPSLPDAAASARLPLAGITAELARLGMTLAFEGKKERRGLHATGEWLRR